MTYGHEISVTRRDGDGRSQVACSSSSLPTFPGAEATTPDVPDTLGSDAMSISLLRLPRGCSEVISELLFVNLSLQGPASFFADHPVLPFTRSPPR